MKKRNNIIILSVCVLFFSIFTLFEYNKEFSKTTLQKNKLTNTEYFETLNHLRSIIDLQTPREALSELSYLMNKDSRIFDSCHPIAHELGFASYKKYGFAHAMEFQDDICNSGYIHGVIENYFYESFDKETFRDICKDYDANTYRGWQCYHGIGHGFMFVTDNNLPESIKLCEELKENNKILSCANGVYMENFNTDQKEHISSFLDPLNPFYPCDEQKEEFQNTCYLYAPTYILTLNASSYIEAFNTCKDLQENHRSICIHGTASEAMKQNISNPLYVESLCKKLDPIDQPFCISGMTSLAIYHYGEIGKAEKLCTEISEKYKPICEEVIDQRKSLFE